MMIGAAPFGLIFGTLAVTSAGLSFWGAMGFSLLVFAGSAQFVAAGLLAQGAGIPVIVFTTFVVNVRHVLYGASLALTGRFPPPPRAVRLLAYVPVAVLTALVVPYVVIRDGAPMLGLDNAYLVGAIIAVLISYASKNLLLTILGGMLGFFGYQALL